MWEGWEQLRLVWGPLCHLPKQCSKDPWAITSQGHSGWRHWAAPAYLLSVAPCLCKSQIDDTPCRTLRCHLSWGQLLPVSLPGVATQGLTFPSSLHPYRPCTQLLQLESCSQHIPAVIPRALLSPGPSTASRKPSGCARVDFVYSPKWFLEWRLSV